MNPRTKKVIRVVGIYLRKSRAEDGVKDLEKHKAYLIGICEQNGWDYELYEEIESSVTLERKELQRLRKDIKAGKIDAVMVNAVDRLSRKTRHFLEIIEDYFVEQGVTKLFVREQENDLTDNTTNTILSIQATLSQAEYSFIVKRLQDGLKALAREKGIKSGRVVFGYCYNKETKKMEQVPEEATIVREIIDLMLDGATYGRVRDLLNLAGHRTRKGNLWDIHNIKSIINSPLVRGHLEVKWKDGTETINENAQEEIALMNDAEYYQIQEILKNRADNYKSLSKAPTHFLQGILTCPRCGKHMTLASSKKRKMVNGKATYVEGSETYYVRACRNQVTHEKCGNTGVNAEKVEEHVRRLVKLKYEKINGDIKKLLEMDGVEIKKSHKQKIEVINKAIEKIEKRENDFDTYLKEGIIEPEKYKKLIGELKEEKANLHQQHEEAKTRLSSIDIDAKLKNLESIKSSIERYDELESEEKRQLIQNLFNKIKYNKFEEAKKFELESYPA